MFGHPLWSLVKPRIVALLTLTGTTALVAAGGMGPVSTLGFVVAGMCIAGGSAALNCLYDRDIDGRMERTADRPLVSGELGPWRAGLFAVMLLAVGTVIGSLALPGVSVVAMWVGVVAYVGLYTVWLKRRTRLGVVLGGSAGAFPVLAGWTAVRSLSIEAVLMAAVVFVWTPAHAWALAYVYRDDFARVGIPTVPAVMAPVESVRLIWVGAVTTAAATLILGLVLGPVVGVAVVTTTPLFVWAYYRFYRTRRESQAVRAFFTSNAYLAVVFLAWAIGATRQGLLTILVVAVVAPLTILGLWWRQPALRGIAGVQPALQPSVSRSWSVLTRVVGTISHLGRGVTASGGDGDE